MDISLSAKKNFVILHFTEVRANISFFLNLHTFLLDFQPKRNIFMSSITVFTQVSDFLKSKDVVLVTVSKTQSIEDILERYALGQRIFGENRVQELVKKQAELPKDMEWHQIGHLQTNKVKFIAPFIQLVHAGDSFKLLQKINSEADKVGRIIDVLLQVKVAQEETKYGFAPDELADNLLLSEMTKLTNIRICGVMGMASFSSDQDQVRTELRALRQIFDRLKGTGIFGNPFSILSMGMSGDYQIAIEEGSTMVRIGSLIF